jgi:C1A family cysteine protease
MTQEDSAEIRATIEREAAGWEAADTVVSVLPPEERQLRLGYVPGPTDESLAAREQRAREGLEAAPPPEAGAFGYPATFDWRNVGGNNYITPVRDQGGCGSCVAFGTAAAVEGTARARRNNPTLAIDLSEAHLFYCIAASQGRNCQNGWWPDAALDGFKNVGIADDACFPYTAGDQSCNLCADWQTRITKVTGWHAISTQNDMRAWLATHGPLVTCFTVYTDFFFYSGGIYQHVTGRVEGGHCVCVVGYDDINRYWICKNSWGTGFGESGYFRIAYGDCGIDSTMWAVEDVVSPVTATGALYRYWNPDIGDHFYTTNWSELGSGNYGWHFEGIQCYVYAQQQPGTVPLYRYWNPAAGDHFYTTNWSELGSGNYGWHFEFIQCYVNPSPAANTVPLYRYWNPDASDHFYTTNWSELGGGNYGWHFEGIQCYVLTTAAAATSVAGAAGAASLGPPATFTPAGQLTATQAAPPTFTSARATPSRPPSSFQAGRREAPLDSTPESFAMRGNPLAAGDPPA